MNDQIRQDILIYLNNVRLKAGNERRLLENSVQIFNGIKEKGYTREQIVSNLDYLEQAKFVKSEKETNSFKSISSLGSTRTAGGTIKFKTIRYKITPKGVDMLEGKTSYSPRTFYPAINITAENSQVIVGNENIVSGNAELIQALNKLQQTLLDDKTLPLENRQNAVADVESLKQQFSKPNPLAQVVKPLWQAVKAASTSSGAIQFVEGAKRLIDANFPGLL